MQTIEQENTIKPSSGSKYNFDSDNTDDFFDDYNFSSCNFGMYRNENKTLDSFFPESGMGRDQFGCKDSKFDRDSGLKDFSYVSLRSLSCFFVMNVTNIVIFPTADLSKDGTPQPMPCRLALVLTKSPRQRNTKEADAGIHHLHLLPWATPRPQRATTPKRNSETQKPYLQTNILVIPLPIT